MRDALRQAFGDRKINEKKERKLKNVQRMFLKKYKLKCSKKCIKTD